MEAAQYISLLRRLSNFLGRILYKHFIPTGCLDYRILHQKQFARCVTEPPRLAEANDPFDPLPHRAELPRGAAAPLQWARRDSRCGDH